MMSTSSTVRRWPALAVLILLLVLTLLAPPAAVADSSAAAVAPQVMALPVLQADIIDYVMGNRSRLIQITTIGFMIALVVLMKK